MGEPVPSTTSDPPSPRPPPPRESEPSTTSDPPSPRTPPPRESEPSTTSDPPSPRTPPPRESEPSTTSDPPSPRTPPPREPEPSTPSNYSPLPSPLPSPRQSGQLKPYPNSRAPSPLPTPTPSPRQSGPLNLYPNSAAPSRESSTSSIRPRLTVSLIQPSQKKKKPPIKLFRVLRTVFRSFPIFTPVCKINGGFQDKHGTVTGVPVTGTLFGYRRGRVSLCVQQAPRCLPSLVIELAMQTSVLQKEMSLGMVRIALECEKRPSDHNHKKLKLLEEPIWTMFCNGKKSGYGFKRETSEDDLHVMELLKAVSMGAGVLPGNSDAEGPDGEMAYMRAHFEHVVGSKDSETLYLISPGGSNGPELSIFFVRV